MARPKPWGSDWPEEDYLRLLRRGHGGGGSSGTPVVNPASVALVATRQDGAGNPVHSYLDFSIGAQGASDKIFFATGARSIAGTSDITGIVCDTIAMTK